MAQTNSERQKTFKQKQQKKVEAGVKLYAIFAAHFKEIKQFLSKEEREQMNEIAEVLENA